MRSVVNAQWSGHRGLLLPFSMARPADSYDCAQEQHRSRPRSDGRSEQKTRATVDRGKEKPYNNPSLSPFWDGEGASSQEVFVK